ncbi:DoxX family protein [Paenibacillus curdlanolyticus YK9]|uniref:DoxX family protein n=1 Tax=Paenibacillus curdlanolyticus YK9 TaxID=717606 RepID=E0IF34_9BACL|nr:DoxX family protein [Paenibacillus curdlanolyticus]EFM08810.1 DoxX family protein [Paenibacillus curdlanolyticus YK9]
MYILSIILQSWLLFSMAFFGGSKIAGAKHQVDLFEEIKLPQWFRIVTGYVQIAGAVGLVIGYWYPEVAAWTGVMIGIMMLLACLSHFRVKHPIGKTFPAILNLLIAAAIVVLFG